jgi:hypothetical protein
MSHLDRDPATHPVSPKLEANFGIQLVRKRALDQLAAVTSA